MGCVNFFFSCSHSQVGRVRLSLCELNKGTLVQLRQRGRVLWGSQSIMYDYKNKSKSQFQKQVMGPASSPRWDNWGRISSSLQHNQLRSLDSAECWLPFRKPVGSKGGNRDQRKVPHLWLRTLNMSPLRATPVAVQKYKPGLTLPKGHNLSTLISSIWGHWKICTDVRTGQWQLRGTGAVAARHRGRGCVAQGRPRGATPRPRSGAAAERSYSMSKVRSSGCALLEQPWRDIRPR